MNPFFSVIIPTYNRSQLLLNTLTTLANQTFKNFELLVIDDGGDDDTAEIVASFNDERFFYYWKNNEERGAARNFGAALAKGKYLNFFDSDDYAYKHHLKVAYDYFTANNNAVVIHNSFDWKYADFSDYLPAVVNSGILNAKVFRGNILSPNGVFIRKKEFAEIKYSEDRELSGTEDWFLGLQLACRYPIYGLSDVTSAMVQHNLRSMVIASGDGTLLRTNALAVNMANDPIIMNSPYGVFKKAMAEMYFLSALYYSIEGKRSESINCMYKAFKNSPAIFLRRRSLAVIKYFIKSIAM